MAPGTWFKVIESPQPARLGSGLRYVMDHAHRRADHHQSQNRRRADSPRQDCARGLPFHRGNAVDTSQLAAAVRVHSGRGIQAADLAGKGERAA